MRLICLYGPVASGKLTIARLVAEQTGLPLFHNHLIVDAVSAVFPFGSTEFVELRERFWMDTIRAAALAGRSFIFTFAPEPTVTVDFPDRLCRAVNDAGGQVLWVALHVSEADQERRLVAEDRAKFGKLRSLDLLRELRPAMAACFDTMPPAEIRIDTGETAPIEAANMIVGLLEQSINSASDLGP